jgi:hypothetical protein
LTVIVSYRWAWKQYVIHTLSFGGAAFGLQASLTTLS